jgi:hypothetical protein
MCCVGFKVSYGICQLGGSALMFEKNIFASIFRFEEQAKQKKKAFKCQ